MTSCICGGAYLLLYSAMVIFFSYLLSGERLFISLQTFRVQDICYMLICHRWVQVTVTVFTVHVILLWQHRGGDACRTNMLRCVGCSLQVYGCFGPQSTLPLKRLYSQKLRIVNLHLVFCFYSNYAILPLWAQKWGEKALSNPKKASPYFPIMCAGMAWR